MATTAGLQEALQPRLAIAARSHSRRNEVIAFALQGLEVLIPKLGTVTRINVGLAALIRPTSKSKFAHNQWSKNATHSFIPNAQ
jgi:hypothetical protein